MNRNTNADKNPIDLIALGKRIRELRCSRNQTQEIFASQMYISTSYLALLETGKRTANIDILAQISRSCHISMDYLLFGKEEPLQAQNSRRFQNLCSQYSEQDISSALSLAEFYLQNLLKA